MSYEKNLFLENNRSAFLVAQQIYVFYLNLLVEDHKILVFIGHILLHIHTRTFFLNKGNNKITELRTILQRESQNS